MTKFNIHILLSLILATVIISSGCKDELNIFPTTSEVDGNVITDTKSAATVLNGVYYRFAAAGTDNNSIPSTKWTEVNEILPSLMANGLQSANGDPSVNSLAITSTNYNVSLLWNYCYGIVNAANGFIKNLDNATKIPEVTKKQMLAEARFLRAFGNTELLLYFGQYYDESSQYGILLRNEFVSAGSINIARSNVADSYKAILEDLDVAISDLPEQNTQKYYANIYAAKLLKARLLINRRGAADYAAVITLCNELIHNSPFKLESNSKDIFLTKGLSSEEVIMGIQPYTSENYKFQQNQYYGSYAISPTLSALFTDDPRSQWVYKQDNSATIYGRYYGPINVITKFYSGNLLGATKTPLSVTCYAFRLTEAYLLLAEATAMSGGDINSAKDLLKTVMIHSGVTNLSELDQATSADTLQLLIAKEYLRNFVSENGADWFAVRRLSTANARILQPALQTERQLILPIPNTEITTNNKMVPNP